MTKLLLIDKMAMSIATMEGFYKPGTLARKNNNPGNLRSWGNTPIVNGFARFSTPENGWAALKQQVNKNVFTRGLTFYQFFAGKPPIYGGYAPSRDNNDPKAYAKFVVGAFGDKISINKVIKDLVNE